MLSQKWNGDKKVACTLNKRVMIRIVNLGNWASRRSALQQGVRFLSSLSLLQPCVAPRREHPADSYALGQIQCNQFAKGTNFFFYSIFPSLRLSLNKYFCTGVPGVCDESHTASAFPQRSVPRLVPVRDQMLSSGESNVINLLYSIRTTLIAIANFLSHYVSETSWGLLLWCSCNCRTANSGITCAVID